MSQDATVVEFEAPGGRRLRRIVGDWQYRVDEKRQGIRDRPRHRFVRAGPFCWCSQFFSAL
jgi:hypothetical protein